MKKLCRYACAALLLVSATACYRTRMILSHAPAQVQTQIDFEGRWYHDAIYGLVEISGPIRLQKVCPGGVSEVYQCTSFLNGLVQGITGNLYNPQSVDIYCLSGASARVQLDDAGRAVAYLDAEGKPTSHPQPARSR